MKKIAVITNIKKDKELLLTQKIASVLLSSDAEVFLPDDIDLNIDNVKRFKMTDIFSEVDIVVTVGGDGTILRIAEELSQNDISVVGVNLGRVGFMAEIEPDEIEKLSRLVSDDFSIEKRMMLDVSIIRNNEVINSCRALNDVVVSKGSVSKICELKLYCNDTYISQFDADGLIVSTPTGSTAYSLSAGGSIIDPTINCLLLTPVCPHSFTNSRSVVFSSNSILSIKYVQDGEENVYLTADGRFNAKLEFSDEIKINASEKTINLIRLKNEEFYDRVYQKLRR